MGGPKVASHCVVVVTSLELRNKELTITTFRRLINLSGTVHILDVRLENSDLIIIIIVYDRGMFKKTKTKLLNSNFVY